MLLSNTEPAIIKPGTLSFLNLNAPVTMIPIDGPDDEDDAPSHPLSFLDRRGPPIDIHEHDDDEGESLSRRELRRSICGKLLGREFKSTDGTYFKARYHCGLWRGGFCPSCTAFRAKKQKGQIQKALVRARDEGRIIKKVVVDESGARSLCGKLKKHEYQRLPQADGTILFIIDSDKDISKVKSGKVETEIEVEELDWDDLDDIDWDEAIQTPDNKRITGGLGKKSVALADDEVEIKAPKFTVHPDTTQEQEIEALTKTFKETSHLDPQTPEELAEAINERTDVFLKTLKKAGGKLLHRPSMKTIKVQISRVSWKKTHELSAIEEMVRGDEPAPEPPLVA